MIAVAILALVAVGLGLMWSDIVLTAIVETLATIHRNDPEGEVIIVEVYNPHGH